MAPNPITFSLPCFSDLIPYLAVHPSICMVITRWLLPARTRKLKAGSDVTLTTLWTSTLVMFSWVRINTAELALILALRETELEDWPNI